jgi:peroxiredoxin
MKRWSTLFLLLLLAGPGWVRWTKPAPLAAGNLAAGNLAAGNHRQKAQPAVGHLAPDFLLPTLDGGQFRLSDQRGRAVVLNFWATWCGPCQRELPALQRAAEQYAELVTVAAVDQAEPIQQVQPFVEEFGLTFTVPMDSAQEVGKRYNVRGLPTTYFIDSAGVIRSIWMGEMNSIILAEQIANLLR